MAQVIRRARAVTAAFRSRTPPFPPERCAARCGVAEIRAAEMAGEASGVRLEGAAGRRVVVVDRRILPRTPQWNGLVALALARSWLPSGVAVERAQELAEAAAAELLLPARIFAPAAARTDLTMDGLRELALRFAAPIRLTIRQWLLTRTWTGYGLLWREEGGSLCLRWRATSPGLRFPPTAAIGAPADGIWGSEARLYTAFRTGRPAHGVEAVKTGDGPAWWFTRFGIVRDEGHRAVLALVVLDRRDALSAAGPPSPPKGIAPGSANRGRTARRRRASSGGRRRGAP
ncbi:MAG TPA: hypothetical protein VJT32_16435 [bacterium]|nr:hypothetical protein [bacterium]